jgi:hypothetical protein
MAHELLEYVHSLSDKLNENEIKTILEGIKKVKDESIPEPPPPPPAILILDVTYVEAFVDEDSDYDEDPETHTGIRMTMKKLKTTALLDTADYNLCMLSGLPENWALRNYLPGSDLKILKRCSCGCIEDGDEVDTGSHTVNIRFPNNSIIITGYRVLGQFAIR